MAVKMDAYRTNRRSSSGFDLPEERAGERLSARREDGSPRRHPIRMVIIALTMLAVMLVVVLVGFIVLSTTPAFTITSIDTKATEHLTKENIAKLADIPEGTTLLNMDEAIITENLKRNPWVGSVQFKREFPDRLQIVVIERKVDCLVKMSTGSVCWCLGDDGVWIEPVNLSVGEGQSADDVALRLSQEMGAILITDVPTSVSPTAGSEATDEVLKAISSYRQQLSDEFSAQIVCFSASSVESISCLLKSGVEVSLGAPNNIELKESVVKQILERHPNQITYINVRVPSQPSYRRLGVESVSEGTGVTVDTTDAGQQETVTPPTGDASGEGTAADAADATQTDAQTDDGTGTEGSGDEYSEYEDYSGYDESYEDYSDYEDYSEYEDYSGYDEYYEDETGY